jgi:hypothetical protein
VRRLAAAVALVVALAVALVVAPTTSGVAGAQTPSSIDVSSCVPGATIPSDRPANGPSPVGHCDPSDRQRAIDTAVWFWVLGLFVVVAVIGGIALTRSLRSRRVAAR